jgi:hypothetical protein
VGGAGVGWGEQRPERSTTFPGSQWSAPGRASLLYALDREAFMTSVTCHCYCSRMARAIADERAGRLPVAALEGRRPS